MTDPGPSSTAVFERGRRRPDADRGGDAGGPADRRGVATARSFGTDVELAPKKGYVSLRRRKQIATVAPAAGQLEICLNLPGKPATDRLKATTGMATHKLRIGEASGLDSELKSWLREAYDRAG